MLVEKKKNTIPNILCLILIVVSITVTIIPTVYSNIIFAAEEEEEEEEKEEDKEEDKDDNKDSGDGGEEDEGEGEKEEGSEDKEEEEQQKEEPTTTTTEEITTNNETINQLLPPNITINVPQPIVNLTSDQILNYSIPVPPVVKPQIRPTGTEEIIGNNNNIEAEPIVQDDVKKEFNATCKCMTATAPPAVATAPPKQPPITPPQQPPPVPPKPSLPPPIQQIPVTSADIQDSQSFGEVTNADYTGNYTVSNLLDGVINDKSFWSQGGQNSGFYIKLNNVLDSYQVCSMELNNIYQPTKNIPFLLDIGVSQNYTGLLDQPNKKIQFDKCVKNMDEILMIFDSSSSQEESFVSIGEIKLFGSKLGQVVVPQSIITQPTPQLPTPQQPTLQPPSLLPESAESASKINIEDSIAEIGIKNSTVTFKFDPLTATFMSTNP